MKSKLEEKKNEFMNELNKTLSCFIGGENHIEAPTYGEVCGKAFDAGISAYKEMLEGAVEVKLDRNSIHDNVVEKWSEHWYDPKINEQDTANYRRRILSVDANMRYSIARMMSEYALPVLAKLQQQEEKIELFESSYVQCSSCGDTYVLARDLKNSEVELFKKITELESRLKEAEKCLEFYANKNNHTIRLASKEFTAMKEDLGKLARQYIEKVK